MSPEPTPSSASVHRYTVVAIVLHWTIAIAIFGQIALGWWMGDAIEDRATQAQAIASFQLHKSIGLTILALSLVRLAWRFTHKPPPYPAHMPAWEQFVARVSHWGFYALMIAMPLTGWLYVSTGYSASTERALDVPTLFFGLFQVPHLFGLNDLSLELRASLSEALEFSHSKLAWVTIGLALLHVGAALKHHFWDKDEVLTHMVPGIQPLNGERSAPDRKRRVGLLFGFALMVVSFAALVFLFISPSAPSAPAAPSQAPIEALPAPSGPEAAPEIEIPAAPGQPAAWRVNASASRISFSGDHAGVPFEGQFGAWRANIRFDPANLDASSARVTIQTGSARDGVPLHEQTLPAGEWFDVANHPTATFVTSRIRHREGDQYEARGVLTIKGKPIDVDLPFTLTIQGERAIMDGRITIRREDADLGMESDPDAEYVSREIVVTLHVEANRQP